MVSIFILFFFKQKTAYEMRISDWSSDVCSSDLASGRKVKLNLPRFLSGELLSQMHLDRLNAIETLYAELSETMSAEGEDHLHQLVAEIGRASCRERVCQDV